MHLEKPLSLLDFTFCLSRAVDLVWPSHKSFLNTAALIAPQKMKTALAAVNSPMIKHYRALRETRAASQLSRQGMRAKA